MADENWILYNVESKMDQYQLNKKWGFSKHDHVSTVRLKRAFFFLSPFASPKGVNKIYFSQLD